MSTRPVNRMRAVHPGEILREDFLAPLALSVNALAQALDVPATRLALQAAYDLKTLTARSTIETTIVPREQYA